MEGKAYDKALAEGLRDEFIKRYNDERAFQNLIDEMEDNCLDRMIHRLKSEVKINIFRDYNALKETAGYVKEKCNREIFSEVCIINDARAWINDNGKYKTLVFEALYKVYRRQEGLKELVQA